MGDHHMSPLHRRNGGKFKRKGGRSRKKKGCLPSLLLILTIALLLLAAACYPQEPGTVHVEGDSITWQWQWFNQGRVENGTVHSVPGATIDTCPVDWWTGCEPPPPVIKRRLEASKASIVVLRLGTNDAKVWNQADTNSWTKQLQKIRDYSDPDACIAVVKPWVREDVHYHADIVKARAWMDKLTNVQVVDWKPWAVEPLVLGVDGVHLATNPDSDVPTDQAVAAIEGSTAEAIAACSN